MKVRGVCLRTVEEQRVGGDDDPLDPEEIETTGYVPIRIGFQGTPIGVAVVQLHERRLWAEAEVQEKIEGYFAVGFARSKDRVVLTEVGVTQDPIDRGSWPIEELSDG